QDDQAGDVPDPDGQAGLAGRVAQRGHELQETGPDAQGGKPGGDEGADAQDRDNRVQQDVELISAPPEVEHQAGQVEDHVDGDHDAGQDGGQEHEGGGRPVMDADRQAGGQGQAHLDQE